MIVQVAVDPLSISPGYYVYLFGDNGTGTVDYTQSVSPKISLYAPTIIDPAYGVTGYGMVGYGISSGSAGYGGGTYGANPYGRVLDIFSHNDAALDVHTKIGIQVYDPTGGSSRAPAEVTSSDNWTTEIS